ncbi:hypothetical protein [Leptospira stimsonii]|uniref:Uncharacterized protein n=1 Tax=Leptospira stimsonii TaxID=2202203 RepID=A0A396ZAQ1_9LEPT|nr:hypothetical protein [Leptospira stimsonii]RHX92381.1 hypothetical protein DLM75_04090 [Leptospira stimsonii]
MKESFFSDRAKFPEVFRHPPLHPKFGWGFHFTADCRFYDKFYLTIAPTTSKEEFALVRISGIVTRKNDPEKKGNVNLTISLKNCECRNSIRNGKKQEQILKQENVGTPLLSPIALSSEQERQTTDMKTCRNYYKFSFGVLPNSEEVEKNPPLDLC